VTILALQELLPGPLPIEMLVVAKKKLFEHCSSSSEIDFAAAVDEERK